MLLLHRGLLPASAIALCFALPVSAQAEDFYVDPARGSAAGAGTMGDRGALDLPHRR